MKKTLILSVFPAIVLATGLFAFSSASAQDYYDSYGTGGYGGFDFGYGMGSAYDSYGTGGYGGFDSYGSYDAYGCGYDCGSNYASYNYIENYSLGCGSFCGGFGGFGGYGFNTAFVPPVYVPPRYNPPVYLPPVYVPPTYQPPTYLPPVYVPPTYNPPTYMPPIYTPPSYPPPVYYPPPVVVPPLVCSIRFSNFNPPLAAAEGQLWSYTVQSISTGSYSNQISYRLVSGPDGMIVMANGQMAWTPAFNQGRATPYMVTVAAYNGNCENAQTFYITVADMNPVPPAYHPKPKLACATTCTTTVTTCTAAVIPTCLPKPVTPQYGVCPPDATAVISSTSVASTDFDTSSGTGFSVLSAFSAAFAGLFGALLALLYSPWLLLAVIIILVIMVIRAYQRVSETRIAI